MFMNAFNRSGFDHFVAINNFCAKLGIAPSVCFLDIRSASPIEIHRILNNDDRELSEQFSQIL